MKSLLVFVVILFGSISHAEECRDDLPLADHMRSMYTTYDKLWGSWDDVDNDVKRQQFVAEIETLTKQLTSTLFHIPSKLVRQPESTSKRLMILEYRRLIVEMLALNIQLEKTVIDHRESGDAEIKRKAEVIQLLQSMSTLIAKGHALFRPSQK